MNSPLLARVFAVLALLALIVLLRAPHAEAAASLYLQQRCEANGTVSLGFSWEGNDAQALQQWIDVSSTGTWQPGTFSGAGPLAANVTTFVWPGWQPGTRYFARVNQQLANGAWDPSITYRVEVMTCGGGPTAPTAPVAPPSQAPQQPATQPQTQTQAQTPGGPQIASMTNPIGRGKDATVTVKTQPNTTCSIAYTPPSGATPTAEGLGQKTADASGIVFWTWRISGNTSTGDGSVSVTCAGQTTTAKLTIIEGGR